MLFIATISGIRRIVSAAHEAEAALHIEERYGKFPDKIEVAPWYTGSWDE